MDQKRSLILLIATVQLFAKIFIMLSKKKKKNRSEILIWDYMFDILSHTVFS